MLSSVAGNIEAHWLHLEEVGNCPEVLEIIPPEDQLESNEYTLSAESSPILGLEWIIAEDTLQTCRGPNKECPKRSTATSRAIICVSSVFDRMENFARFTMRMRIRLNIIWIRFGQSSDGNISEEDKRKCRRLSRFIFLGSIFSISPRTCSYIFSVMRHWIMCIVAYLRAEIEDGIEMSFVVGKCWIAPIKQLSIARFELQAALYSVRLRKLIIQNTMYISSVLLIGQIPLL